LLLSLSYFDIHLIQRGVKIIPTTQNMYQNDTHIAAH